MIKAGIIGGAGFTGGELLRLLVNHPGCEVVFAHSNSQQGQPVAEVHRDLLGETELVFKQSDPPSDLDLLFFCMGHGKSRDYLAKNQVSSKTKIIDLSHDYRLAAGGNLFLYGLPELNREKIKTADRIANPGCFATAIQLALLPLAAAKLISSEVHVHAITGSTGAGAGLQPTTHFSWRQNNLSVYKAFEHQHLSEIRQSLELAGNIGLPQINFIPVRGNFTKGIFCTAYTDITLEPAEVNSIYQNYYSHHPFTLISSGPVSLKEVINTNKCYLHLQYHEGKLLVTSVIDNLIKGASGQAIQNMNLMFGLDEDTGLRLKASGF